MTVIQVGKNPIAKQHFMDFCLDRIGKFPLLDDDLNKDYEPVITSVIVNPAMRGCGKGKEIRNKERKIPYEKAGYF